MPSINIRDYAGNNPGEGEDPRLSAEIARLRAINAELLAALETLRMNYVAALNVSGARIDQRSVKKADAAIAKAKGEAT